jgi:hypothetical protein
MVIQAALSRPGPIHLAFILLVGSMALAATPATAGDETAYITLDFVPPDEAETLYGRVPVT